MGYGGHRQAAKKDGSTGDSWHAYVCGHCGREVSGAVVAMPGTDSSETNGIRWLWCPSCGDGSVRAINGAVYPSVQFGPEVEGLPPGIGTAYSEARDCMGVRAFTAAELLCRKLLMYVAVEKGAPEKDDRGRALPFVKYLDHLKDDGYITPTMDAWVGLIREHGNDAAHDLDPPSEDRAKSTVLFTAELLRVVYEMPHFAAKYAPTPDEDD